MVTRYLGSLVARGNTSDVHAWGRDAVVKILRPGIPDDWAAREAKTTELVHAAGLPAPSVLDLTMVNDRPGIVLERINGDSMWDQMVSNAEEIPRLAALLAQLQAEINATPAPSGIPELVRRLEVRIGSAPLLSPPERTAALAALRSRPAAGALCHFDVHPNNVLMGSRPTVIDWFDAATGSPAADIVRSSALMRRDATLGHLPCSDASLIELAHNHYLAAAIRFGHVDESSLLGWESPVLAARLAEPIADSMRSATYESWRARQSSGVTPLSTNLRSLTRNGGPG